jgi:hypothetical protein
MITRIIIESTFISLFKCQLQLNEFYDSLLFNYIKLYAMLQIQYEEYIIRNKSLTIFITFHSSKELSYTTFNQIKNCSY